MTVIFTALADRSRSVNGKPTSLADVGYTDAGLDDCWQKCGSYISANYTYHDANGSPVVDTTAFPDLKEMTDFAHSLNLTAGWYGNNCRCKDHCSDTACFAGDVAATLAYGFDSIKLDGCGQEENVQLWYDMFNSTIGKTGGKGILIENCHNGPNIPTTQGWCPFHLYRSSDDIRPVFGSVLSNLQTVLPLVAQNLSYPGCWAYPDMLEVGVTNTQSSLPMLTHTEARSHFGAWCIVSAPLTLGLDLTDKTTVDSVWDIITNTEAIAINQDYAGKSGDQFYTSTATTSFSPCHWGNNTCVMPSQQYWYKPLSNGDFAVLLMNNGAQAQNMTVSFADIPGLKYDQLTIRDVWAHVTIPGCFENQYTIPYVGSRDSVFLRLSARK